MGLESRGIVVRFPAAAARDFSLLQSTQIGYNSPPPPQISYSLITADPLSEDKAASG